MDIKIFDSILHGVLKPWVVSFPETQELKEIIRNADKIEPTNAKELQQKLQFLLYPFKELSQLVTLSDNEDLKRLSFKGPFLAPLDLPTTYYRLLIDAEALRYFNAVMNNPFIIDKDLDIPFQIEHKVLKSIATLANEAQTELIERGLTDEKSDTLTLTQFVLISLKNSLIDRKSVV